MIRINYFDSVVLLARASRPRGPNQSVTRFLYSCPNVAIAHHAVRVNIVTPTPMRAPGEIPGLFAVESAIDELAYKLNMDPLQLRIINHSDKNEHSNRPCSSKYLNDCYQLAAERFGWAKRDPKPRAMLDGSIWWDGIWPQQPILACAAPARPRSAFSRTAPPWSAAPRKTWAAAPIPP